MRLEKFVNLSLLALSFVYVGIYSLQVIGDVRGSALQACELASNIIWVAFILDFICRTFVAKNKFIFIRKNLLELAGLLLPAFRTLRMLRVITALSRFSSLIKTRQQRINIFLFSALPLIFYMCALGVLEVERDAPGSTINTFTKSIWWALTTVATVGYGDLYPVTDSGRLIAAVLLLTGIGFMSLVTANIAAVFMKMVLGDEPKDED